jgi:hypothetical protein
MWQPVLCFAPRDCPPSSFSVDLIPFHTHDLGTPLRCKKAQFHDAGRKSLYFQVRVVGIIFVCINCIPDELEFIFG